MAIRENLKTILWIVSIVVAAGTALTVVVSLTTFATALRDDLDMQQDDILQRPTYWEVNNLADSVSAEQLKPIIHKLDRIDARQREMQTDIAVIKSMLERAEQNGTFSLKDP